MKSLTYVSTLVLLVAVAAWAAVIYADSWIQETARQKGRLAITAEDKATSAAQLQRMQALAKDTAADRERLETFLGIDIVTLAEEIEDAGAELGINTSVATVLSGATTEMPTGEALREATFIVQAQGTFSGLVRLVKLFEQFPAFSSVQQFELQRAGDASSAAPWRATIRLKILTTADTSV